MSLTEEFKVRPSVIIKALNKGFWFRESELDVAPDELERFVWKNSCRYDAKHKLIFQPGLEADHDNIFYSKAVLGITNATGEKEYYLATGIAVLLLRDHKITWSTNKQDLIKKGGK